MKWLRRANENDSIGEDDRRGGVVAAQERNNQFKKPFHDDRPVAAALLAADTIKCSRVDVVTHLKRGSQLNLQDRSVKPVPLLPDEQLELEAAV